MELMWWLGVLVGMMVMLLGLTILAGYKVRKMVRRYKTLIENIRAEHTDVLKDLQSGFDLAEKTWRDDHSAAIHALKADHDDFCVQQTKKVSSLREGYKALIGNLQKDWAAKLVQIQEYIDKRQTINESLLRMAVPSVYRTAALRESSPDGETAARWLYIFNCMGGWDIPDKDAARIVARGQLLSGSNPTKLDDMLAQVIKDNPKQTFLRVPDDMEYDPTEEEVLEALEAVRAPVGNGPVPVEGTIDSNGVPVPAPEEVEEEQRDVISAVAEAQARAYIEPPVLPGLGA